MSNIKNRRYCFTLNNPNEEQNLAEVFTEASPKLNYAVWQLESAPTTGTHHLQGYLHFDSPVRMSWIKSHYPLLDGAHFTVCSGSVDDNYRYCTKEDSRLDGPWEYGDKPRGQGQVPIQELAVQWLTDAEMDDNWVKFIRTMHSIDNPPEFMQ